MIAARNAAPPAKAASPARAVRKGNRRSNWQMFGWPLVVGVAAVAGLVLGLTGDGLRDALAVVLLCIAPGLMLRAWMRRG